MEPIAVVGLALKFPGDADSEDGLWRVLMEKKCTMTEWPADRLNVDAFYSPSRKEKSSVRPFIQNTNDPHWETVTDVLQ